MTDSRTNYKASGSAFENGGVGRDAHFVNFFTKTADEKTRRITAAISSGEVDRDNEIVDPAAIVAAWPSFMRNPIVLPAHTHKLDSGEPPAIGVVRRGWRDGDTFMAEIEFATTELAETYWRVYRDKVQRAFSIGFIPKRSEYRVINGQRVRVHVEIELLEISAVAVPSNPSALSKAGARKQKFIAAKEEEEEERRQKIEIWGSVERADAVLKEFGEAICFGDRCGRLPDDPEYGVYINGETGEKWVDTALREKGGLGVGIETDDGCPDFVAIMKGKR